MSRLKVLSLVGLYGSLAFCGLSGGLKERLKEKPRTQGRDAGGIPESRGNDIRCRNESMEKRRCR